MVKFSCDHCGTKFEVQDDKGGRTVKCAKCERLIRIPLPVESIRCEKPIQIPLPVNGATAPAPRLTGERATGFLWIILGGCLSGIGMVMDIGVVVGEDGTSVANLARMNERLCFVIGGGLALLAGVIVLHLDRIYQVIWDCRGR